MSPPFLPLVDVELNMNELQTSARAVRDQLLNHPKADRILDEKELKFVSAYLLKRNASEAARDAGYKPSTASSKGWSWVICDIEKNTKPWIFRAICQSEHRITEKSVKLIAERISDKVIDASFVEKKTVELLHKSNGDIPTHYKPRINKDTGEEEMIPQYSFSQQGVAKSLELLGKHKNIRAFDNSLELTADSPLANILKNLGSTTKPPVLAREHNGDISDGELIKETEQDKIDSEKPAILPKLPNAPRF